nr:hypothetical protein [Bacillus velezensis]
MRTKTLINRKLYIHKNIIPRIGNFKLNELNRVDYQKFINELSENFARKTVQTIHSIFCSAINKAVEHEIVSHNKYQNISIKKIRIIECLKTITWTKNKSLSLWRQQNLLNIIIT